MKKIFVLLLLSLFVLGGCSTNKQEKTDNNIQKQEDTVTPWTINTGLYELVDSYFDKSVVKGDTESYIPLFRLGQRQKGNNANEYIYLCYSLNQENEKTGYRIVSTIADNKSVELGSSIFFDYIRFIEGEGDTKTKGSYKVASLVSMLSQESSAVFDKIAKTDDFDYLPVALLGKKIDKGNHYIFLAAHKVGEDNYKLHILYVTEKDGNVTIENDHNWNLNNIEE